MISAIATAQQITEPFNFPIRPGTKEWSILKSENERFNALQIPTDNLKRMTTYALVISCINYPAFGYITANPNIQAGLVFIATKFNGLDELAKRSDAEEYLMVFYKSAGINGFENSDPKLDSNYWTIKFSWIELLLAQNKFIETLPTEKRKELLKLSIEKHSLKQSSKKFSSNSLLPTAFLAGRIIHSLNNEKFEIEYSKNSSLSKFIQTSTLDDRQVIDLIFSSAINYLK